MFTLAAPSLKKLLSPFTDGLATFGYGKDLSQPYPFSVPVDAPLSLQDIFTMKRDQFEGTLFDMTAGVGTYCVSCCSTVCATAVLCVLLYNEKIAVIYNSAVVLTMIVSTYQLRKLFPESLFEHVT